VESLPRNLVIGSGPAAAAVTLALLARGDEFVTVIDLGASLEPARRELLATVASGHPEEWSDEVRSVLAQHPVAAIRGELPQKRILGSDFPFRELGQLEGIDVVAGGNRSMVSAAFGGFSNAWGAQILPFSREAIAEWPISYEDLLPHYAAILRHLPFAGVDDDYSELFPLLVPPSPLPPLSDAAQAVLERYAQHRRAVHRCGVLVGSARLAFAASRCIECGLCLTGCPFGLIYSARQTLEPAIRAGSVEYQPGLLALEVGEDEAGCWARTRRLADGAFATHRADRIFVAAGALGSTRIVLNSVRQNVRRLEFVEPLQFVLPFFSVRARRDPRMRSTFTLNQVSMVVRYGRAGLDLAHLHLYPYNPAFEDELPAAIASSAWLTTALLKRTVGALGYLPSWASPATVVHVLECDGDRLPVLRVSRRRNPETAHALTKTMGRLLAAAPALDLWPGLPVLRLSGPGKTYHFGGSLPHVAGNPRPGALETDSLGRVAEWRRIHLVDGAVLPTVPATTFTLSVMANAHRIATAVVGTA
jgi:choline dehydrogenase-like flavoprotein